MMLSKLKKITALYRDIVIKALDGELVGAYGMYDKKKSIIYIDPTMPDMLQLDTILHELGHAFDYELKISCSGDREHFADSFSTIMFSMFKENPLLIQAMVELIYDEEHQKSKQVTKKVTKEKHEKLVSK